MLEIEIKARINSIQKIERILIKKGAAFKKEVVESDLYLNHPSRDFARTDEALRLRETEGQIYLTYKGPKIDRITKTREELTVRVENWESTLEILRALGFIDVRKIVKKRRYLVLNDYLISLDYLEGLGSFIEVEKKQGYNPDKLVLFLKSLGIKDSETRSYLELMLELKK